MELYADRLPDEVTRGLGWVPDLPDIRDWRMMRSVGPEGSPVTLPPRASTRAAQSPYRDQDAAGSCVGQAVAGAIEYLRRTDKDLFSTLYSPMQSYYDARALRGWQNVDSGSYIRDAVKLASKIGIAPESAWPYDLKKLFKKPNHTAYKKAERWKLGAYYRCESLVDIKAAIAKGYPVVGGFSCYANMFTREVARTGYIPRYPSGQLYGGHAVLFVEYDDATEWLTFKNSWGPWGDQGYGFLHYDFARNRNLADDFWALTEESEESFRGEAPRVKMV